MVISYHAVSIPAKDRVMRVCAALVRVLWTAVVTVARINERLFAASVAMNDQVSDYPRVMMILRNLRSGQEHLIVVMGANEVTIAANTAATRNAIHRSSQRHTALGPQT